MGRGGNQQLIQENSSLIEADAIDQFIRLRGNIKPPENTSLSYTSDLLENYVQRQADENNVVPELSDDQQQMTSVEVIYKRKRDKRLGAAKQLREAQKYVAECYAHARKLEQHDYYLIDNHHTDDMYGDDPTVNLEFYQETDDEMLFGIVFARRS